MKTDQRFLLRDEAPHPGVVSVSFSKDSILTRSLPTNFISSAYLDFEMMKLLGTVSASKNKNFDSLFVPFRCVGSDISKKESVGYGRAYKAKLNTTIAIIPVGYADGLSRTLSQGKWSFLINGQSAPIIGNICMDMCMVDVTKIDCKSGDSVEIFGSKNTVFQMAKTLNTIPYEIISSISSRVHRVYLEE